MQKEGKPTTKTKTKKAPKPKNEGVRVSWLDRLQVGHEPEEFIENLALLVSSGMNISVSLAALKKDVRTKSMGRVISYIEERIDAGEPLWSSLEKTKVFSSATIALIRVGESSGRLSENLKFVVESERKARTFRSKLTSAMLYPVLVLGVTGVVGIGVAWFILPRLAQVFSQLDADLPLITQWLISGGEFLDIYGLYAVPGFILFFVLLFYFLFFFPKTKFMGEAVLLRIPMIRRLVMEVELARMGYILGTLISSGLTILEALSSLIGTTNVLRYQRLYSALADDIEEGMSFTQAFERQKHINRALPPSVQQIVVAGERSGHLPQSFQTIGEAYEEKIERTTKNLAVALEPILLVVVWLGVVGVAVAVILPIYSLTGQLNNPTEPEQETQSAETSEKEGEVPNELVLPDVEQESATTTTPLPENAIGTVEILETPLGYLNVRSGPETTNPVVSEVFAGEQFPYLDEELGWFLIEYEEDSEGWIYGDYAEIINE